ncbi:dynein axonemal intermediate chain 4 isoform X4 [Chiloscyllium plagiosum]|uniref:dynein axonemal intermediate chain 4 isoform X4 n=1 Tax=Chiloscyllium plagiosum TaxID=36176 RepID=UPI001CB85F66|nr:dynein axonemal intermediate chain 4 isoform X4 [Chiloscyllium plagiosum]
MKKTSSKIGGSMKKFPSHPSVGNFSRHSNRSSYSFMGSISRQRVNLQGEKILDKGYIAGGKYPIQVFDETGKDVTPHPLIVFDAAFTQSRQSKIFTSQDLLVSDYILSGTMYQTIANASFVAPFTRSTYESSSISRSSRTFSDSLEDIGESGVQLEIPSLQYVHIRREDVREQLSEDDLNKIVDVYLTETETFTLLDLPVEIISVDSAEAEVVKLRNQLYIELCKERVGNDRYIERMAQTFNGARKTKEVQCDRINIQEAGVMATTWDMYDSFKEGEVHEDISSDQLTQQKDLSQINFDKTVLRTLSALSSIGLDPDGTTNGEDEVVDSIMLLDLMSPRLQPLWSFTCYLTKGRNVSCMVWNKHNLDLLAVGYGQFGYKEQRGGLICCWSLKNPMWPERIYNCESGVTALEFSADSPNLLAVGHYDGTVAIYNIRNPENGLVLDSSNDLNKHIGPVWQLKWTEQDRNSKGDEKEGTLISIAADGRVAKWTLAKGLESSDLMRIKRTGMQTSKKLATDKEKKSEASISRYAAGMCFSFHPKEANIYLAGTEEGYIHKCSYSYNEQFLETYGVHKGPVYKVVWSPFSGDTFLSCSADWSIHVWSQETLKPILRFSSTITKAVHDIMWSPKSATVFGAVNEDRVEIWDLTVSILDPVIICPANEGSSLSTILFAKNTDCVLIGDSNGEVIIYELLNMHQQEDSLSVLDSIISATLTSQIMSDSYKDSSEEPTTPSTNICDTVLS